MTGSTVVVVSGDSMGRGDDGLGAKLMASFLRTLTSLPARPEAIVFYNSGVRLLGRDSAVLEPLRQLEEAGVELLACVTCLEFFDLTQRMALGEVSNMRAIAQLLMQAGKVITV